MTPDQTVAGSKSGSGDDAGSAPDSDSAHESKHESRAAAQSPYDTLVRVTAPSLWIGLGVLLVVILGVVAWSVFYEIDKTVDGDGVLLPDGGVSTVVFTTDGALDSYTVAPGDSVSEGDSVATVTTDAGTGTVTADTDGVVLQLSAVAGEAVKVGDTAVVLDPADAPLVVYAYLPLTETNAVEVGQRVQMIPFGSTSDGLQHFLGSVRSIGALPVSASEVAALTGSEILAEDLVGSIPMIQIVVSLAKDSTTVSGFETSNDHGADQAFSLGALAAVKIVTERTHPIDEVFS